MDCENCNAVQNTMMPDGIVIGKVLMRGQYLKFKHMCSCMGTRQKHRKLIIYGHTAVYFGFSNAISKL